MFSMIRVLDALDPLLNRPFSISFINRKRGWFDILYRIIGKGTEILSQRKIGEKLKILAPLGQGYPEIDRDRASVFLIGGGIGIAPLLSFFETEKNPGIHALFWGVKSSLEYINLKGLYPTLRNITLRLSSEDGSIGTKGTVVELFRDYMNSNRSVRTIVYACGPERMLYALHTLCLQAHIPLFVSVESRMACGMGYCLGCALPRNDGRGYLKVCQDGPVFDSTHIDWEKLNNVPR